MNDLDAFFGAFRCVFGRFSRILLREFDDSGAVFFGVLPLLFPLCAWRGKLSANGLRGSFSVGDVNFDSGDGRKSKGMNGLALVIPTSQSRDVGHPVLWWGRREDKGKNGLECLGWRGDGDARRNGSCIAGGFAGGVAGGGMG
jgi:hypothetical protein